MPSGSIHQRDQPKTTVSKACCANGRASPSPAQYPTWAPSPVEGESDPERSELGSRSMADTNEPNSAILRASRPSPPPTSRTRFPSQVTAFLRALISRPSGSILWSTRFSPSIVAPIDVSDRLGAASQNLQCMRTATNRDKAVGQSPMRRIGSWTSISFSPCFPLVRSSLSP
jgi:hypothetical protein